MINDKKLYKVSSVKRVKSYYQYYDKAGVVLGVLWYSMDDASLPSRKFYCSWDKAEVIELEIYDLKNEGKWRYLAEFPTALIESKSKHMSSKLAINIWNYVMNSLDKIYIKGPRQV